jgi:tripartite-type tricarboxylate transporter receptor subunit TctC
MNFKISLITFLFGVFATVASANTIDLVVPYAPGGAADSVGRALAKFYENQHRQNIVVSNRSGGGGTIGTQYVLNQPVDGRTLLVANSGSLLFNKVFYKNQTYDYSEFDIAGPYAQTPSVFAVSNTEINTVEEFVALSQTKKNITCGTSSTSGAVVGKSILKNLGMDSVEVITFRGSNEVTMALLGKHIDCSFDTLSSHLALYKNKNINIIAIGSNQLPQDFSKAVLYKKIVPGLEFYYWYGVAVPKSVDAKTRRDVLKKFSMVYKDPEFRQTMSNLGLEAVKGHTNTTAWMDQQYQRFNHMRETLGIPQQ